MTILSRIKKQLSQGPLSCRHLYDLLRPSVPYRLLNRSLWEMEKQGAVKVLYISACEALNTYRDSLSEGEQRELENIVRWRVNKRAGLESLPVVYLFFSNNGCHSTTDPATRSVPEKGA